MFFLRNFLVVFNRGKSKHPGVIVDLSQNPGDPTRVSLLIINNTNKFNWFCSLFQLYIGFSTHLDSSTNVPVGHVICWNLQQKTSESVYTLQNVILSLMKMKRYL